MVRKGFKNLAIGMAVIMMLSQSFPALALENTEGHWQKEDGQQVAGVSRTIPEVLGVNRSSSGGYGRSLGSGSGNVSAESFDQQSQLQKQKEEAEKKGKMQRRKPKKKGRKKSRKRKIKKRKSKKSRKKRKTFPYWKESIAD